MRATTTRSPIREHWARGIKKSIRPARIRPADHDLSFFREMSKVSRRVTAEEIDELIGPA